MLLTSSQVSVAVSSGVVLVFTAALFFSGYAIQQRTLRDLRQAIKPTPRPSPKIFLPDRFQKSTTELPDGTVIEVEDEYDLKKKRPIVVVVNPTLPEEVEAATPPSDEQQQQALNIPNDAPAQPEKRKPKKKKKKGKPAKDEEDPEKPQKPISRAERRRRIKEELQKMAQGEEKGYYQRRLW
ncbi:hypothetical protein QBC34DRAFT_207074 [Podospora aff. communis PSN243]|uniref:Uncharacterized protein n=1 Tax=Podospora aff. communis PSN243 TaxID=3040156 RepID=A0AAV9GYL6_9PEZI|nr:hypothetical protein QBC34DRAFT_207074 [Podospora aff. communis PSN243]